MMVMLSAAPLPPLLLLQHGSAAAGCDDAAAAAAAADDVGAGVDVGVDDVAVPVVLDGDEAVAGRCAASRCTTGARASWAS